MLKIKVAAVVLIGVSFLGCSGSDSIAEGENDTLSLRLGDDIISVQSGEAISSFDVEVIGSGGSVKTSYSGVVTATSTTSGVTLSGTTSVTAVAGVATFASLIATGVTRDVTLTFTADDLTPLASNSFHVASFFASFSQSDGDLAEDAEWETDPTDPTTLEVSAGKVKPGASLQGGNVVSGTSAASGFYLESTFQGSDTFGSAYLIFSSGAYNSDFDNSDAYSCQFVPSGSTTLVIISSLLGVYFDFIGASETGPAIHDGEEHILGCEVTTGGLVRAYIDGTIEASYLLGSNGSDPNYGAGAYGIFMTGSASNTLDNFTVTESLE